MHKCNDNIIDDNILNRYPDILKLLLQDKTTKKNILWATDDYESNGESFKAKNSIYPIDISHSLFGIAIQPRVTKNKEIQSARRKIKGEVFTPTWICNEQNNQADEIWFERKNVFNVAIDKSWVTNIEKIVFNNKKTWKKYVDAKRIEITCGEAPYLVSRYDMITGDIIPIVKRIGLLDRKLRVVNENTETEEEWIKWVIRAYQSIYGYEYQGDNVLIARENLLYTFWEYYIERFKKEPEYRILKKIANIITWNIWQMDGLKGVVPYSESSTNPDGIYSKIMDWRDNNSIHFNEIMNEK